MSFHANPHKPYGLNLLKLVYVDFGVLLKVILKHIRVRAPIFSKEELFFKKMTSAKVAMFGETNQMMTLNLTLNIISSETQLSIFK